MFERSDKRNYIGNGKKCANHRKYHYNLHHIAGAGVADYVFIQPCNIKADAPENKYKREYKNECYPFRFGDVEVKTKQVGKR